jgi:hypothetical protein
MIRDNTHNQRATGLPRGKAASCRNSRTEVRDESKC